MIREVAAIGRVELAGAEQLLGVEAGLDPLGEADFLLGGEQLGAADAVEVGAHDVGTGTGVLRIQIRLVGQAVGTRLDAVVAS